MTYVKGDILINELPATCYELLSLRTAFIVRVASYIYCTNYKFLSAYKLRVTVTFIARITIFFLHTSYELLLVARVTSWFLHTSYELMLITRVTSYFLHTSYDLLFIARFTSFFLHTSFFVRCF